MKAQPQGWRWKATLLFTLVLCATRGLAAPATGNPNEKYRFDIAAGIAAERLNDFGSQSGIALMFGFDDMNGITLAAVHGEYKPFEALDKLIAGTDIRYRFIGHRTIAFVRAPPGTNPWRALRHNADALRRAKLDRRSAEAGLEEVTISGSPPSALAATGSPVLSISRADIEATGVVTTQGVLRTLPQVFGGGPTEDTMLGAESRTNVGKSTGVNLRGLDAGSTMVLMNGQRLPGSGSDGLFTDVSNLPLVAIERIDILADSSSSRYGADAVGGVVNFVMRDDFVGRQTEAYFGNSTRGGQFSERYLSQLIGMHTASGHGLLAFDFHDRDNLPAAAREMAKSNLTEYGGSDFDVTQSNPGNITLGTTTWAVPKGQDGTNLKPGDFVKNAPNLQDRFKGADVLPTQKRWTGFGTWRQDLRDATTLFGDLLLGQRDEQFASGGQVYALAIPATNAFYSSPVPLPPNIPLPMSYNFYDDLGPIITNGSIKSADATVGLEEHFATGWSATATLGYANERTRSVSTNVVNGAALTTALASPDRSTAFNPFGDGSHTSATTLESIRGYSSAAYDSTVTSASALVSGPMLTLPGGDLELAFGGDIRKQRLASILQTDTSTVPVDVHSSRDRTIRSGFAELKVPIVGPMNQLPAVESLVFSAAERYEHYSDFGSALTPRLGLSWAPLRGVVLEGSYSASFRPPGVLDTDESNNVWGIVSLQDPKTGGLSNVLIWSGKNRDLRDETAHSWSAGVKFAPEQFPGTALALTWFSTDFTDRLSRPNPGPDLLTNPSLTALITRDPSPEYRAEVCSRSPRAGSLGSDCETTPIVAIADARIRNDAIVKTRGIDTLARYETASDLGRFSFSLNGTYIFSFAEAKAADLPLAEYVSTQTFPINLKMRGSAHWQRGAFDISTDANFMNSYKDIASSPQRHVASWTTFDLRAAYIVRSAGSDWFDETTFAFGVENLFDRDPPFLNNSAVGIGYDQENGDLTGRMLSFTVRTKW